MRNHWIKCAYCMGQHPTESEFKDCADRVIAGEVAEWRRDHAEMVQEDDLDDCASADLPHPETSQEA